MTDAGRDMDRTNPFYRIFGALPGVLLVLGGAMLLAGMVLDTGWGGSFAILFFMLSWWRKQTQERWWSR
jgi:hypothetical protein